MEVFLTQNPVESTTRTTSWKGTGLVSDGVADGLPALGCHALGHGNGRYAPRLRAHNAHARSLALSETKQSFSQEKQEQNIDKNCKDLL